MTLRSLQVAAGSQSMAHRALARRDLPALPLSVLLIGEEMTYPFHLK
jgi:hypothetical protein